MWVPRHWLVKNTRAFIGTLGGLVVNWDKGKKHEQHQPHHRLHSVSYLQNGDNYWSNRTKQIIKLEKTRETPRSIWKKEEMEQRYLFVLMGVLWFLPPVRRVSHHWCTYMCVALRGKEITESSLCFRHFHSYLCCWLRGDCPSKFVGTFCHLVMAISFSLGQTFLINRMTF